MKIKGIEKRKVEIDIQPIDAILALADNYGLSSLFIKETDRYTKIDWDENDTYLKSYENQNGSGSLNFEKVWERKLSDSEAVIAKALCNLYNETMKEQ